MSNQRDIPVPKYDVLSHHDTITVTPRDDIQIADMLQKILALETQNLELRKEKGYINKDSLEARLNKLEQENKKLSAASHSSVSNRYSLKSSQSVDDGERSSRKFFPETPSGKRVVKTTITTKNNIINNNNNIKKFGKVGPKINRLSLTRLSLSAQNIQPLAHAHTFDAIDEEGNKVYQPFLFQGTGRLGTARLGSSRISQRVHIPVRPLSCSSAIGSSFNGPMSADKAYMMAKLNQPFNSQITTTREAMELLHARKAPRRSTLDSSATSDKNNSTDEVFNMYKKALSLDEEALTDSLIEMYTQSLPTTPHKHSIDDADNMLRPRLNSYPFLSVKHMAQEDQDIEEKSETHSEGYSKKDLHLDVEFDDFGDSPMGGGSAVYAMSPLTQHDTSSKKSTLSPLESFKDPILTFREIYKDKDAMSPRRSSDNSPRIENTDSDYQPIIPGSFEFCIVDADLSVLRHTAGGSQADMNEDFEYDTFLKSKAMEQNQIHKYNTFISSEKDDHCNVIYSTYFPSHITSSYPRIAGLNLSIDTVSDFCFPSGVSVNIINANHASMFTGPSFDRFHLLRFTNGNGETTYACCLTINVIKKLPTNVNIMMKLLDLANQQRATRKLIKAFRHFVIVSKRHRWYKNTKSKSNHGNRAHLHNGDFAASKSNPESPAAAQSSYSSYFMGQSSRITLLGKSAHNDNSSNNGNGYMNGSELLSPAARRNTSSNGTIMSTAKTLSKTSFFSRYFSSSSSNHTSSKHTALIRELTKMHDDILEDYIMRYKDRPVDVPIQSLMVLTEALKKAKDSSLDKNNCPIVGKCDELLSTFGIGVELSMKSRINQSRSGDPSCSPTQRLILMSQESARTANTTDAVYDDSCKETTSSVDSTDAQDSHSPSVVRSTTPHRAIHRSVCDSVSSVLSTDDKPHSHALDPVISSPASSNESYEPKTPIHSLSPIFESISTARKSPATEHTSHTQHSMQRSHSQLSTSYFDLSAIKQQSLSQSLSQDSQQCLLPAGRERVLVTQQALCMVTTSPHHAMFFNILTELANAERSLAASAEVEKQIEREIRMHHHQSQQQQSQPMPVRNLFNSKLLTPIASSSLAAAAGEAGGGMSECPLNEISTGISSSSIRDSDHGKSNSTSNIKVSAATESRSGAMDIQDKITQMEINRHKFLQKLHQTLESSPELYLDSPDTDSSDDLFPSSSSASSSGIAAAAAAAVVAGNNDVNIISSGHNEYTANSHTESRSASKTSHIPKPTNAHTRRRSHNDASSLVDESLILSHTQQQQQQVEDLLAASPETTAHHSTDMHAFTNTNANAYAKNVRFELHTSSLQQISTQKSVDSSDSNNERERGQQTPLRSLSHSASVGSVTSVDDPHTHAHGHGDTAASAVTVAVPFYLSCSVPHPRSLPTTQEWTCAILFACLSPPQIFKIVNLLLMEKSLVIVGSDVGLVTALSFAVTYLLTPFTWAGVFIPVLPDSVKEVFDAPVPFIVGTTVAPKYEEISSQAAVLVLQQTTKMTPITSIYTALTSIINNSSNNDNSSSNSNSGSSSNSNGSNSNAFMNGNSSQLHHGPMNNNPPRAIPTTAGATAAGVVTFSGWFTRLPEVNADLPMETALQEAVNRACKYFQFERIYERRLSSVATARLDSQKRLSFRLSRQSSTSSSAAGGGAVTRSHSSSLLQAAALHRGISMSGGVAGSSESVVIPKAQLQLNMMLMTHMTQTEKNLVNSVVEQVSERNFKFVGNLCDQVAWPRYVRFNAVSEQDEFLPELFMEPIKRILEFQEAVVQTQLFVGFVDRIRLEHKSLEPFRVFLCDWISFRLHLRSSRSKSKGR